MPRPHGRQCESWWGATAPASEQLVSTTLWLVSQFQFTAAGRLFGFRLYRRATETQPHWVLLSDNATDKLLVAKQFFQQAGSSAQWLQCWIGRALRIDTTKTYNVFVAYPGGHWFVTPDGSIVAPVTHGHVKMTLGTTVTGLNPLSAALGNSTNPGGADVLFLAD